MTAAMTGRGDVLPRRTDLDWARIAAFALLILFHVGMFYGAADWIVKSPHTLPWLQIPMDWSSPWRLLLLFIVSGAATRFMSAKLSAGGLLKSRSLRLLPPLLFATVFVIPIEFYYQAVERLHYTGGFIDFWRRYLAAQSSLCAPEGPCPFVPNLDYLWFVAYLWLYTVAVTAVLAFAPQVILRIERRATALLEGDALLLLPAAALILARLVLKHYWPETHNLIDDWYLHAIYFLCFVFGFLFATNEAIWAALAERRCLALGIAVFTYAIYAAYAWHYRGVSPVPMSERVLMVADYGIDQWAWVAAVLGFAHRYLTNRDGRLRRYLTDAIFPYYIVHQVAIVAAAHYVGKLRLPLGLESGILVAATVASCAATYEIVRRLRWLRPWFGLKRLPPVIKPAPSPAILRAP